MCKLIRFIYLLIPIHGFRSFLIQKHFDTCPQCQKEWGLDQSMPAFLKKPAWPEEEQSLWPRIQGRLLVMEHEETLTKGRKETHLFPGWRWAIAGLALLIFVGITFLTRNKDALEPGSSLTLQNPPVHIIHAKIQGNTAAPYIYQTPGRFFIWFEEIHQEED